MTQAELKQAGKLEIMVYSACVLERAAEYCGSGWCQHVMGRDENGKPSGANSNHTVCWCASGACLCAKSRIVGPAARAVLWNGVDWESMRALERAIRARWPAYDDHIGDLIPTWNDDPVRTQGEVVATLNVAARELRGWLAA